MSGTLFSLEVEPQIPEQLTRLSELANNLLYSWDRQVRGLFFRLDRDLWESCGHNPKLFLRRIEQEKLETAASDPIYMQDYNRVLSSFDTYLSFRNFEGVEGLLDPNQDLVSYSCAEFGLHESFPIYSGGLGILAGDYCKATSDLDIPMVAIGILYRRGYFHQSIDGEGNQQAGYISSRFSDLPVQPVLDSTGVQIMIPIDIPDHSIQLRLWEAKIGHVRLLLLDSDTPENSEEDRKITYQLYGGDGHTRLLQEIVLGVGGVRVQRALNIEPTVWHINEGHAAFQVIERCRELVQSGLDFSAALEVVAASTVFTTHTPVPAGHDIFENDMILHFLADIVRDLKIEPEQFLALGASPLNAKGFNMTALALRGSRYCNGVSEIHGGVASVMESYIWPQIAPHENPMKYVTNGVHVPTFLASEWMHYFDLTFGGGWRFELRNEEYWERIESIPDYTYWSTREALKSKMIEAVLQRITQQHQRNGCSESQIGRLTQFLEPKQTDVLTIGFARRFATYKRAMLIFTDEARLARLLNDPERPVVLIFAGKAHPSDHPGQELIRNIHRMSRKPEFEGKIILVESYDISLARKLVSGVDVWLNNPEYPMEASGTSGQKAAINGVINLSVLDGWWAEGYNGNNGWAIRPHGSNYSAEFRDREESLELLDILEYKVIPCYYHRNGHGYSAGWIEKSKSSMKSMLPRFNAQRMVMDYVKMFYTHAAERGKQLNASEFQGAKELAQWKKEVLERWPQVSVARIDEPVSTLMKGQPLVIEVAVQLNGLRPEDINVTCLIGSENHDGEVQRDSRNLLTFNKILEDGRALYCLSLIPNLPGLQAYMIRIYPYHRLLSQEFEMGRMLWV